MLIIMRLIHSALLTLSLLFGSLLPQFSQAAEELGPGVLYQPGTQLKVSTIGVQLSVPGGWQAILPQGSEVLVMEPVNQLARMIVSAIPDSTVETLKAAIAQPQPLDNLTVLQPSGAITHSNGVYRQQFEYQGYNPQNLAASAFVKLGNNATAVFVIMLEPKGQGLVEKTAQKLIESLRFNKIASNTQAVTQSNTSNTDSQQNIDWNKNLRGRTLRYLKTGNGLSVDKRINLCSNGQFFYSDQDSYLSSGAVSNFSSVAQSNQAGRWQISTNQLLLNWNDGSTSRYTLSRQYVKKWGEWGTFVDDQRWFNVANEVCQ